ncbi:MAG: hypothetical protein MJ252_23420 [archaeon]|nr:hypothetical protein [archaeon]
MQDPNSFEQLMETAAHIKEYQMNQDKQKYNKNPDYFKATLFHWYKSKDIYNKTYNERKEIFNKIKSEAIKCLQKKEYEDASDKFCQCLAIFRYMKSNNPSWKENGIKDEYIEYIDIEGDNETEKKEIKQMKISSLLNISLCEYCLKNWTEVRSACDDVLSLDSNNIKALYRKAKTYLDCPSSLMDDYLKARKLLKQANELDSTNIEIKKD